MISRLGTVLQVDMDEFILQSLKRKVGSKL